MGRNNSDFGKASGDNCVRCGDEIPEGPAHSTMHDRYANVTHHFDKKGAAMFSERNRPTYIYPEGNREFSAAGKHCYGCNNLAESAETGGNEYAEHAEREHEANQPDSYNDI
jgi:hypothetical protein